MKPTIAIYFDSDYFTDGKPTFLNKYYRNAYENLIRLIIKFGGEIILSTGDSYLADNQFRDYWRAEMHDSSEIFYTRIENSSKEFHIVLAKGCWRFASSRKINPRSLRNICHDKYLSYLFAPDFHAPSFLLQNENELDIFALSYANKKVAIKELNGNGGKKVFVGEINEYRKDLSFPLLAQDFIDTSGGAPNLHNGIHDVRVAIFNGEIIHGLLRWPSDEQELRTNFSIGGNARALFVSEIPEELIRLTKILDKRFATNAPRFFCADWGFDKNSRKWKLFELNNSPGLAHESEDGPAANEFLDLLAKKLIESANCDK